MNRTLFEKNFLVQRFQPKGKQKGTTVFNLVQIKRNKHPASKPTKIRTKVLKATKQLYFFESCFKCGPSIAQVALDQLLLTQLAENFLSCKLARLELEIQ